LTQIINYNSELYISYSKKQQQYVALPHVHY